MDIGQVTVYGDSLAIGWPDVAGVPVAQQHSRGASKVLTNPENPELGWGDVNHPEGLWQNVVLANAITDVAVISLGRNDLWLSVPPGGAFGILFSMKGMR